jgi:hypothetical protein
MLVVRLSQLISMVLKNPSQRTANDDSVLLGRIDPIVAG